MKDPFPEGHTMNRITAIALLTSASILGAGSALAEAHAVKATMQFDFAVANKVLPPGSYTISKVTDDVIEIKNRDRNIAVLAPAYFDSMQSGNGGKLVFDKYDNQYFLREILVDNAGMNVYLPPTKSEKRAHIPEAMARSQIHSQSQVPASAM